MSTNSRKGVEYMLATILKMIGVVILALVLFMTYALVKAASMADEYEGFDEYWKNEE